MSLKQILWVYVFFFLSFFFDELMSLLGLLTNAWMECFYSPRLWPAERRNSVLLARCLNFLLTLYIPELSDSLPWLSPKSSSQGGLLYSWGRSCKEWLQGAQASHLSLAPAFQPFLCGDAYRQVMRPLQAPGRRPRISELLVAGLPV